MWAGGFWWVLRPLQHMGLGWAPGAPGVTWFHLVLHVPFPAGLTRASSRAHGQGPRVDAAGPVPKAEAAAPLRSSLRVLSASLLLLTRHEQVHTQKGRGVDATSHQGAANLQVSL